MTWFYLHCVIAIVIVIADARGTLETTVKDLEQRLGIPVYYESSDSMEVEISEPYPIQDEPEQDTFNNRR